MHNSGMNIRRYEMTTLKLGEMKKQVIRRILQANVKLSQSYYVDLLMVT